MEIRKQRFLVPMTISLNTFIIVKYYLIEDSFNFCMIAIAVVIFILLAFTFSPLVIFLDFLLL